MKSLIRIASLCIALCTPTHGAGFYSATAITFDDLPAFSPGNNWAPVPNGYGGLQWNNFGVIDGSIRPVTEGYRTGLISPQNVAFNRYGDPALIQSSAVFSVESGYFTSAFVSDLQLTVQAWRGLTMVCNSTYTLNPAAPTLINFNCANINRIAFTASPASQFAMDNLVVVVPEPASGALVCLGVLLVLRGKTVLGLRSAR